MWIIISVASYFLTALNSVVDKYILNRPVGNPLAYAFYVGVFSIFSLILTPFGFEWPGLTQFFAALSVGGVFLFALITFFAALQSDEASRIVSIVGGTTPVFIVILSVFLLEHQFILNEMFALVFLISGSLAISARKNQKCGIFEFYNYRCIQSAQIAILSAFFFALFFVFAKFVFLNQPFVSGFVWTRIGSFLAALIMLLIPHTRRAIFSTTKKVGAKIGGLFVINKAVAGIAFFMLNYAIFLGNIAIVNALEGVKYAFVLLFVYILSKWFPTVLAEDTDRWVMFQKAVAVVLICAGLTILYLY